MTKSDEDGDILVKCVVKNCQKEIHRKDAMIISGEYYCKTCGVAMYRTTLSL